MAGEVFVLSRMRTLVTAVCLLPAALGFVQRSLGAGLLWDEDFSTDPIPAGRFSVPPGHDAGRFTYDVAGHFVTVHYDALQPTAWYVRPLDPSDGRVLGRCDDFEFNVTFRIRGTGFSVDPSTYMQIGWGLINSQTTGEDRAGGSAGPYAFDMVGWDYFPNVAFGGPTLGPAVVHSDEGQGFFSAIDFPFGAESFIDASHGDQAIAFDTIYTATVAYSAAQQTAVLTVHGPTQPLAIDVDGGGGPGGPDQDATTIQTTLFLSEPFAVDSFALTAWQDTFNPFDSSVIAEVDVMEVRFSAPAALKGDLNRDGRVDGRDIALFVDTLLAAEPDPCRVARADFDADGFATTADMAGFEVVLLTP